MFNILVTKSFYVPSLFHGATEIFSWILAALSILEVQNFTKTLFISQMVCLHQLSGWVTPVLSFVNQINSTLCIIHVIPISSSKHCICGLVGEIGTSHVPAICPSLTASFLQSVADLMLIEVSEEIACHTCGFVTHMNQFYHSSRASPETVLTALFLITKSLFGFLNMDSCVAIHSIIFFKIQNTNTTI